ncbi:MFS transporter [Klebsiella pneumoniae]|nr:MFS transporter [Klebsiella pneumoniae]MDW1257533.1 MFS transporter [Klebsiella pneumoniae]
MGPIIAGAILQYASWRWLFLVNLPVGVIALLLVALFLPSDRQETTRRKAGDALIDLRLFRGKVFSIAAVTQFLSNGGMFAGQMLIPAFLIQACGRTPGEMGWMLAPLGIGMMLTNSFMGALTDGFGVRRVSAGGAFLAFLGTLPMLYLAVQGLNLWVLTPAMLLRVMGISGIGLPSLTAAYASVHRKKMPMATTSLNIVQRLGGPTMTICP